MTQKVLLVTVGRDSEEIQLSAYLLSSSFDVAEYWASFMKVGQFPHWITGGVNGGFSFVSN